MPLNLPTDDATSSSDRYGGARSHGTCRGARGEDGGPGNYGPATTASVCRYAALARRTKTSSTASRGLAKPRRGRAGGGSSPRCPA